MHRSLRWIAWVLLPGLTLWFVHARTVRARSVADLVLHWRSDGLWCELELDGGSEFELDWSDLVEPDVFEESRRVVGDGGRTRVVWRYTPDPDVAPLLRGARVGEVRVLDLLAVCPRLSPAPDAWSVQLHGDPQVLLGDGVPADTCRRTFRGRPSGRVAFGQFDPCDVPNHLAPAGRPVACDPRLVEALADLQRALRPEHELLVPNLLWLPGSGAHLDQRSPVGLLVCDSTHPDALGHAARCLGRGAYVLARRATAGAPRDDVPWYDHGIAAWYGWALQERVTGPGCLDQRLRELWEAYEATGPHAYSLQRGPVGLEDREVRVWEEIVAPLAVQRAWVELGLLPEETGPDLAFLAGLRLLGPDDLPGGLSSLRRFGATRHPQHGDLLRAHSTGEELPMAREGDHGEASLVLVVSEDSAGFLETCGCAVSQSGGAARRDQRLAELRQRYGERMLSVDLGNRYPAPQGPHDPLQAPMVALLDRLFARSDHDLLVPDPLDVAHRRGLGPPPSELPLLAANLPAGLPEGGVGEVLLDVQGLRVGCVGLSALQWRTRDFTSPLLEAHELQGGVRPWEEPLARSLDRLRSRGAQLLLVLGSFPRSTGERIARLHPDVDLLLSSNPVTLRALADDAERVQVVVAPERIGARHHLVANVEAYALLSFGVHLDAAGEVLRVDWAYHDLDPSVADDPGTRAEVEAFYRATADEALRELEPLFPGHGSRGGGYVGSDACATCHAEAWRQWSSSRHGGAYRTLLAERRHFVPKCVRCHVVGLGETDAGGLCWERPEPGLLGVGCEVCHGGGRDHLRDPRPGTILRDPGRAHCTTCHDEEHAPGFAGRLDQALESIRHW